MCKRQYKTIDLCSGIGGIRKGFENATGTTNVLSCEINPFRRIQYEHLYNEKPLDNIASLGFQKELEQTEYDIALMGFPCQSFSMCGNETGLNDERGKLLFELENVISHSKIRPKALFLENVPNLLKINKGKTGRTVIEYIERILEYKIIGVHRYKNGRFKYTIDDLTRNTLEFGLPQNRERLFFVCYDMHRYGNYKKYIDKLSLPKRRPEGTITTLHDIINTDVAIEYYLGQQSANKMGKKRGYKLNILNDKKYTSTLTASNPLSRSGMVVWQPRQDYVGRIVKGKQSPINDLGYRMLTPDEYAELQGFKNYAFMDKDGNDGFSYEPSLSRTQRYKMMSDSVSIPVIETLGRYMVNHLRALDRFTGGGLL